MRNANGYDLNCNLPLELVLKNFHVQMVLVNLLLTGTLGLGLIAFLVHEHADLVRGSHALDRLGLEVLVGLAQVSTVKSGCAK